jgi:hypothetical protein
LYFFNAVPQEIFCHTWPEIPRWFSTWSKKSLTYFADADVQLQPKMYLDFNWEICKQLHKVLKL